MSDLDVDQDLTNLWPRSDYDIRQMFSKKYTIKWPSYECNLYLYVFFIPRQSTRLYCMQIYGCFLYLRCNAKTHDAIATLFQDGSRGIALHVSWNCNTFASISQVFEQLQTLHALTRLRWSYGSSTVKYISWSFGHFPLNYLNHIVINEPRLLPLKLSIKVYSIGILVSFLIEVRHWYWLNLP